MRLLLLLSLLLLTTACKSVHKVYDANGQPVDDSPKQGESDLTAHFEQEFDAAFSEEKKNGVPTSTSRRVSSFQKDLDNSKRETKEFTTHSYNGKLTQSDIRSRSNEDAGKRYADNKRYEGDSRTAYDTNLHPDFMDETHGISSAQRAQADSGRRDNASDETATLEHDTYPTRDSRYSTDTPNYYVEDRRNKTEQPTIMNFRDYYRKNLHSTRALLGRDSKPATESSESEE